jgi:predicted aspartyl protease
VSHFSNSITPNGPILNVLIGVSQPRLLAMQTAGLTPPPMVPAALLIDTGASHSCICSTVIQALGLTPTGTIYVHTPTTGVSAVQVGTYDVGIVFTGVTPQDVHVVPSLSATENDFTSQGIQGLLGRDILSRAHMFYNGRQNLYFLSF